MKEHGISNYTQLVKKANGEVEWYWDAVIEDLGLYTNGLWYMG